MDINLQRHEISDLVAKWLTEEPSGNFSESQHPQYDYSRYRKLLVSLSKDAERLAAENGTPAADFKNKYLYPISNFMEYWLMSLYESDKFDSRLWWHQADPIGDAKASRGPSFSKAEVESVVGDYLRLPCRSSVVERALLDCLVAMEFYAFARELLDDEVTGRIGYMRGGGPLGFLKWRLVSIALCLVILSPFLVLAYFSVISSSFTAYVGLGVGLLFVLESVWAAAWFPVGWKRQYTHNKKLNSLLGAMAKVYREFESSGPISASYFRDYLVKTSDDGVAWPSPAYALLDDILKRDGRF